ncbi:MAG: tetratricopeptide repeat protein [Acidobacteria bacterium]|nr:tetratricopeptide repeat protein [Acidobacteriota bacterium]
MHRAFTNYTIKRDTNLPRRTAGTLGPWVVLIGMLLVRPAFAETNQELLAQAAWEVRVFSFDKGYALFSKAMEQSQEGSEDWQQAVFGAGVCMQHIVPPSTDNLAKAEELYRRLIDRIPDSRFTPRAMMNLGRMAELRDFHDDTFDLKLARSWYQRVVDHFPEDKIAGEAMFRVASTYIQTYDLKQVKKGVKLLEDWLKKHPDDPMASGMWQYLGDTYFYPLNDLRKSLDCYIHADDIGLLEKGREGPVYWRMAVMAERIKPMDRENAVKYYTKIITLVPTSGKAYESQLALKRLGAPAPKLEMFEAMMGSPVPDDKTPLSPAAPAGAKDLGSPDEKKQTPAGDKEGRK